jgi:hypothetical protein
VLAAWFDELRRLGFVEGQNLAVDRRGFASSYEQFTIIAADLVKAGLDAMICDGDAQRASGWGRPPISLPRMVG